MKKFDVFCWAVVGLLLVFLWHSSSLEFFQDQITDASGNTTMGPIRGAPYSASDAVKIVAMMPATMKTALKASSGTDDPATLIAPITDLMSDFHGSVYLPATTPITTANVDTFLQSANVPTGLTKADVKTLMVAYFVNQRAGNPNAPLTAAQMAANAQQTVNAAATASNAAAYAAESAAMNSMFARIEAEDAQIAASEMQQAAARASLTAEVRQPSRAEISCKLPEWVAEVFRAYGRGNLSKGLRQGARLIKLHRERIEAGFK